MKNIRISSLLLAAALAAPVSRAQEVGKTPIVSSTTQEVVLDLVVRDKKGKQVRDLDPASLDITDNGVKQKIVSFRLVDGKEALEKGATSALDPMRQVRLVTLVFERLDSESRKRARQASLDLIKGEIGQNTYYSVVTIDQKLNALQEFTNDPAKLRNAIEMATSGAFTEFAARSEAVKNQLQQTLGPADGRTTEQQIADMSNSSASGPAAGAAAAGPGVQARFAAIMLQMLSFEQSMSREQAGRSSIYSLLAIVRNQYVLPGRKTVIYFTEGLQVPPNLLSDFNSVISAANRANVSVYPIDARGLVTSSQNSGRGMLAGAAALSRAQVTNVDGAAVTGDQAKGMDTLEQGLHANVQTNLNDLAEGTGGFLVANTNDLKNPLHRINEDVNSYYEVTYKPDFENFDGSFRKIAVKSSESNVKIQARSGYFALPPTQNVTFAYEVPLLKALEAKPLPRDVEFRSGTIRFRPNGETTQCTVVVEVPMKNITFTEDKLTGTYKARVSLAVLIKNPQGTVVRKFARDLPLAGQSMMLTGVKNGNYIYTDQFAVAPGRYTLEAAILDQEGNKASARKSSFFVPKAGALSMSSLSVIRRVETGLKTTDAANPFEFKGGKVTPTLNTSLAGGKGASLSIYFVVYPDPKNAEKPKLTIEFLKDGQIVGSGSPELPAADESGRIPYLATSSAESMPPGMYEVKARVKQGAAVVEESRTFTVEQQ